MSPLEFTDPVLSDAGEPYYCTAAELRAALGVDSTVLTDAAATDLIETAEDLIDNELGARIIDQTTGRKVVLTDIEDWQARKLKRATILLAARLHNKPELFSDVRYNSVSGPDFSLSGPVSSRFGDEAVTVLNQTGLRRLTSAVSGRRSGVAPWDSFSRNIGDIDAPETGRWGG